jgi:uncharacterized protein YciI
MKTFLIVIIFLTLIWGCTDNPKVTQNSETTEATVDTVYNQQLAEELGADDYGMKQYVMAFLKRGPNRDFDSATAAQLQRAHLDNIIRMAEEGTLVLAGPFLDRGDIRGIYIFDVKTVEEAEALTSTDPAIQAGSLEMELHPWYGSAALMKLTEISKTISKKSI